MLDAASNPLPQPLSRTRERGAGQGQSSENTRSPLPQAGEGSFEGGALSHDST